MQRCRDVAAVDNECAVTYFTEVNATDSFNPKVKLRGQIGFSGTKTVEIMVPLKYNSNLWTTL